MKIKIINKTAYRSDDLRKFLRSGFSAFGCQSDKIVTVRYRRSGSRIAGRGTVGSPEREARRIWLQVPRNHATLDIGDLAHTLHHEWLHNRGARHRDMTSDQMRWNGVPFGWCEGLTIRATEEAPPVRRSRAEMMSAVVERRAEHARHMLVRAERKMKIARVVLVRWRDAVHYYDRKLAAKKA